MGMETAAYGEPIVHMKDEQWYYWDEAWAHEVGPFDTEWECKEDLAEYCKTELGI